MNGGSTVVCICTQEGPSLAPLTLVGFSLSHCVDVAVVMSVAAAHMTGHWLSV
jgi:hypothetical protein